MESFKDSYGVLELVAAKEPSNEDDENTEMETFWDKLETVLQNAQNQNQSRVHYFITTNQYTAIK